MADEPMQDGDSQLSNDDITMAGPEAVTSTSNGAGGQGEEGESDDDEFPSSRPQHTQPSSSPDAAPSSPLDAGRISLKASDPEILRSFYQRLFPWRHLFQWLNHSPTPTNDFAHREFALTLQNDVWRRYMSYPTSDLMRKEMLNLLPSRIEIGPVYTTNPRDRKTIRNASAFKPIAKELCFDIDLTDYDEIRTCCDKANICQKCWRFMVMASKVVDAALREDFGFKHIMWVYSGRRGIHAWVCDKKVRTMDDQKRRAVANYLEVIKGGSQGGKKVNLRRPLHPHISRSLDILAPYFQTDVLATQDPWLDADRAAHLLTLLPDRPLTTALQNKWDASPGRSSASKWADIDAVAKSGASKSLDARQLLEAKQDIVLEYTYPRLDIEVSKKLNHLLKSPFVIHPGTGRVCVPIDPRRLDDFDPLAVPTVQELLAEIDEWKGEGGSDDGAAVKEEGRTNIQDWEKTSLKPYVEYFRTFVLTLMKDERDTRVKREREDAGGMDF
ncbi:DNA primase small subunit [Apiospora kogelbergensis]|uniref:DNA primase small subunit n=1 Tax=Apiospora kogelbergensis TaxID=1337665 RepID=UPI003130533F